MQKYRVGILGCGPRGNSQAGAWKQLPDVELVALCDRIEERLHTVGERHGVAQRYTDAHTMFTREALDIVSVPARADWHYPLTMLALEHGIHVIVEKPIAIDLRQADEMVALAQARGVRLAVHHQLSVGPLQRKAKSLIAAGAIGELHTLRGAGKGYYGGFGMMETGTHILDQMRNFGGDATWVHAHVTVRGRDITAADVGQAPRGLGLVAGDRIMMQIAYAGGKTGLGEFSVRSKLDSRAYAVDLVGTEGMLCLRSGGGAGIYLQRDPVWHPMLGASWEEVRLTDDDARVPGTDLVSSDAGVWMAQEMVNALRAGRDHASSGAAGQAVLEQMLACYASQVSGGRAALPPADRTHPLERLCTAAGLPVPDFQVRTDAEYLAAEAARLGA